MKIVLLGSSSGIGQRLALGLLAAGHSVCGAARSPQPLQERERWLSVTMDATHKEDARKLAHTIETTWGSLDALICCAATQGTIGPAMDIDPDAWLQTVSDNLAATFFPLQAFFPLLKRGREEESSPSRAKVILFSGGGATAPRPYFSGYAVAKSGLVRLAEILAQEWAHEPIDINALAPGALNTRMVEEILEIGPERAGDEEYHRAMRQKAEGGQSFEKLAGLVDFLLSSDSDFLSGRLLSAQWDPWKDLPLHQEAIRKTDLYTLRRITPRDRGLNWGLEGTS